MQSLSKHPLLVVVGFPQWFCLEKSQLRKAKLAHTEFMCFLFDAAICAHLSHTHTPYIWMKVTRWTWTCLNWYYLGSHKSFSQRWHVFSPPHACSCMWGILVKLFSRKVWFSGFSLGPPTWENIPNENTCSINCVFMLQSNLEPFWDSCWGQSWNILEYDIYHNMII